MNQCVFYYDADNPRAIFAAVPVNRGIDEVLKHLEALRKAGMKIVSTSYFTDEERTNQYIESTAWPSAQNHYRVMICFGQSGVSFGRGVPALEVSGDDGMVKDVYPHENPSVPGTYITISDYFAQHGSLPQ